MSFRPILLLLLTVLPGMVLQTSTQQPLHRSEPDTQASEDQGLLLGVYFPEGATWEMLRNAGPWDPDVAPEPHLRYLTFWISLHKGEVTIRPVKGLVVPRKSGFWRIGSQIVKAGEGEDADYDERLWAVPADKQDPQHPETDPEIDGKSTSLITYAGPEYVSYLSHWQGGAGSWEYEHPYVAALDGLTKKSSIVQVLGPQGGVIFKTMSKSLDHMNAEPEDGCTCCTASDTEWGMIHIGAQWRLYARFHSGTSSSCFQRWQDEVLRIKIPQNIWSGGRVNEPWDAIRKKLEYVLKSEDKSVQHLFVSPKYDFAVSVSTRGLAVFKVNEKNHFSLLKREDFPAACIPVSEQWSMGRFVATWDAEMQKQKLAAIPPEAGR
jgi:hypothetical protein